MRLSEIQNKDVINLNSGMKVGNIIDIKINSETGKIESLILEKKKFSSIFNSNDEIEIYWTQINKIWRYPAEGSRPYTGICTVSH